MPGVRVKLTPERAGEAPAVDLGEAAHLDRGLAGLAPDRRPAPPPVPLGIALAPAAAREQQGRHEEDGGRERRAPRHRRRPQGDGPGRGARLRAEGGRRRAPGPGPAAAPSSQGDWRQERAVEAAAGRDGRGGRRRRRGEGERQRRGEGEEGELVDPLQARRHQRQGGHQPQQPAARGPRARAPAIPAGRRRGRRGAGGRRGRARSAASGRRSRSRISARGARGRTPPAGRAGGGCGRCPSALALRTSSLDRRMLISTGTTNRPDCRATRGWTASSEKESAGGGADGPVPHAEPAGRGGPPVGGWPVGVLGRAGGDDGQGALRPARQEPPAA